MVTLKFQWFKDFQVWLFITLYLLIFQSVLIFSFKEQIHNTSGLSDILSAMFMGLRFDGAAAAALISLFFISSISTTFFNWGRTLHKIRLGFLSFTMGDGHYISNGVLYMGKHAFPLYENAVGTNDIKKSDQYYRASQAISWYRVRKGKDLYSAPDK